MKAKHEKSEEKHTITNKGRLHIKKLHKNIDLDDFTTSGVFMQFLLLLHHTEDKTIGGTP